MKGFASGIVCWATKIVEDGITLYECRPDHDFLIYYTEDYIELV